MKQINKKSKAKQLWEKLQPTLKLKKFWLALFSIFSIFGLSMNPTVQDKVADIAVSIVSMFSTETAQEIEIPETNNEQ